MLKFLVDTNDSKLAISNLNKLIENQICKFLDCFFPIKTIFQ